jgi:hypothetical protein
MAKPKKSAPERPKCIVDESFDPLKEFIKPKTGPLPSFDFRWGIPNEKNGEKLPPHRRGKPRMISYPNSAMKSLHSAFGTFLKEAIAAMGKDETYGIRNFPSATGCVEDMNPLLNAKQHEYGEHFYKTDFKNAYMNVDLQRLSILLVYIVKYDYYRVDCPVNRFDINIDVQEDITKDTLFVKMESFVQFAFGGYRGKGLAVGGPLSPFLLNLYCEVFLDQRARHYLLKRKGDNDWKDVTYTRFVDDLVFSSRSLITQSMCCEIRKLISYAGFEVKHRKSSLLNRALGTVFVTKVGLRVEPTERKPWDAWDECAREEHERVKAILTFSQKKRRRLWGIIGSYMATPWQNDSPEVISGLIAEFIYYWKNVEVKTASDIKLMNRCKEFEEEASPRMKEMRERRKETMSRRAHEKKWRLEKSQKELRKR